MGPSNESSTSLYSTMKSVAFRLLVEKTLICAFVMASCRRSCVNALHAAVEGR